MADGPAGLRLAKYYYVDDVGVHGISSGMSQTVMDLLPGFVRLLLKLMSRTPKNAEIYEQWCTAIPIGTAIAQSFDPEFACELGDIVGKEMEIYNVDLWLAPALNIHRDVLC